MSGNKLLPAFAKTSFTSITNLKSSIINDDHKNKFFSVFQTKYIPATGVASADILVAPPAPSGSIELAPILDPTDNGKYTSVKMYPQLNPSTTNFWISELADATKKYLQAYSYTSGAGSSAALSNVI